MAKIDLDELRDLLAAPGVRKADAARWFGVTRWAVSEAVSRLERGRREIRTPEVRMDEEGIVHGRRSTYTNAGCRCDDCRAANAAAARARRSR